MPIEDGELLRRDGRAQTGYHVRVACQVGADRIEVALDQYSAFGLTYALGRSMDAEYHGALVEHLGLRGVQVFGLLALIHRAAAERNDRPRVAADWDHEPVAKPVARFSVVAAHEQPALDEQWLAESIPQ